MLAIIMAAVVSAIFLKAYQHTTRRQYRMQLEEYADSISRRFQEFITNEDYASCLSYLEILSEIGDYEIWSIANPYASQPMNRAMATIEFSDVSQEDYTNLIYSAFLGKLQRDTWVHDDVRRGAGYRQQRGNLWCRAD